MADVDSKLVAARIREKIRLREAELAMLQAELTAVEAHDEIPGKRIGIHSIGLSKNRHNDEHNPLATTSIDTNSLSNITHPLNPEEYQRYGRQLILPHVGSQGQVKLRNSRVLIVGVGGLGCPAAAYLAGAGVGTLGLIDGDSVDVSNLHRQILHATHRVGMSKVESAEHYLRGLNPLVTYHKYTEHLSPENAVDLFSLYDVVLDCTDHPKSRYLISDSCVLAGKPLVSASALKVDGQLIVLNYPPAPPGSLAGGPCYRCIFPKPPPADSVISCGEGGILGPVVGTMGVLQALEAIKLLCTKQEQSDVAAELPKAKMLMFSGFAEQQFRTVRMRSRRPDCAVCSQHPSVTVESLQDGSMDYVLFCGANSSLSVLEESMRVAPAEWASVSAQSDTTLIDTRDTTQFDICSLTSAINIPWTGDSQSWTRRAVADEEVQKAKNIYIICRLGNDSQLAANALSHHPDFEQKHIRDIKGGLKAWRQQVDPNWPDY